MTDQNDIQWYVIRCFSGHEKKVKEALLERFREDGAIDKVEQVLIPTETVIEIRNGKKRQREKNFFPGYIMFQGVYDESINDIVSGTASVIGFLKGGKNQNKPTPLQESEVNRILGKVTKDKEAVAGGGLVEIPFRKGDLIKITDGPFVNYDGTVEEVYPDRMKLIVHVSIFGRKTPVEVDVNQVEPD
ncbi:transcription antitermination protein nusG [Cyclonatronum proteinivorum]|uniref:Transcription termination/antitermination protein NusG n=1 Tax=Cyclonatronum proteinivorum TaxID=1457365 RepID=A0A345UII3_9BACT|nr:transcription termination/antitermination protein NusG [Cyclonatronum proteinivorum]AXJ00285.1 transcription antitermination protein nusG [Cyclonatronum proteinivorum]